MKPKSRVEERGIYFGYPACCIRWFIENRGKATPEGATPLTPKQEDVHGYNGFIPCPKCAEMVTAETIHALIKNRQCPAPYPHELLQSITEK